MQDILINLLMWIVTTLSSIFITPIVSLLTSAMPDLGIALNSITTFVNTYLVKFIAFAKEVFLNVSCCPEALLNLVITYLLFKIAIHAGIQAFKLILKIWNLVKP